MKYLGKGFFKFTLGFLCIICLSLLVMALATRYLESDSTEVASTETSVER